MPSGHARARPRIAPSCLRRFEKSVCTNAPKASASSRVMPYFTAQFFGGTSVLILVGVLLDLMRQVETQLLQRNYDGFLRKGKIRGRYEGDGTLRESASSASGRVVLLYVALAVLVLIGISTAIYRKVNG